MSKIKHFYSTSTENTSYTNMDNVLEYCKQFLANNFRLDWNTTEYVCANLLQDDDGNVDDGQPEDDAAVNPVSELSIVNPIPTFATMSKTSVVRSRCPLVVEWYALFDFIISTATIVSSSGKPNSQRVQMTVRGDDDDVDDSDINVAAIEYNLLEYDIVVEGFAWPPVLRLKPSTFKRHSRGGKLGSNGKHDDEMLAHGEKPSLGRVYYDWMTGGLNMFWQCGPHCWTVTLLISLMFLMSVFGSIVAVIAIRCVLKL